MGCWHVQKFSWLSIIIDIFLHNRSFHSLAVLNEELSDGEETAPEKRLRLAKDYLSQLKTEGMLLLWLPLIWLLGRQSDEEEIDNDAIAQRLHEEVVSDGCGLKSISFV